MVVAATGLKPQAPMGSHGTGRDNVCPGASPQTAEQKPNLPADWELYTRKSCGLHQGTGARGWGLKVRGSKHEAVEWAKLALRN